MNGNLNQKQIDDSRRGGGDPGLEQQTGCSSCSQSDCSAATRQAGESEAEFKDRQKLHSRLCGIKHKIVVMSGKGGVGKSTVAVNLAMALALSGKQVGLLDVDIHGPSIPTMLGLEGQRVLGDGQALVPMSLNGVKVMSLGFLMPDPDAAVIWRGPMKSTVIKQFLRDVAWGVLDYLIIDSPPGTGDEPLSVCQIIGQLDGAVIVTTPQRVAEVDVRKSITFCRQMHLPVLGIVENMSGFCCPLCGEITPVLRLGGGKRIAESMGISFLGAIPMDPKIAEACDNGQAFIAEYKYSATAKAMQTIIDPFLSGSKTKSSAAAGLNG